MTCPPDQLDYQIARHLRMHMRQWPGSDREKARASIRKLLKAGQAWLWPLPVQMGLFEAEEAA